MQKAYDHNASEDTIYQGWEDSGSMRADNNSAKDPFTIVLPPPNVTGQLHLGHAAMLAIEDILIRYKAMTGKESLWVPGTDHAAIATENVVIKHLGLNKREEMSREDFLEEARKFASEKHDTIVGQSKKMGTWLDWSREAYTFDESRNHAVTKMFQMLYEDGLIERGYRMINWSVGAQSVLADDELEWEDKGEPFYYIRCGEFIIGTVRSETKNANSPVIVHPDGEYARVKYIPNEGEPETMIFAKVLFDDKERLAKMFNLLDGTYELIEVIKGKDLEGQEFEYDTYAGKRKFYVLADEVIDMEKGTGAMTISVNHATDDYELAQKHNLKDYYIQKIDFEGNMTAIAGPCEGMSVAKARKESGKIMKEMGLLVGQDNNYQHRVPLCYRSDCVVEPMISPQWFIMVEKEFIDKFTGEKTTLKKQMQEAVRGGHVKIIPERFEKTYFHWIDNLRDWCISRQIWWGHRIPVWYDNEDKIHLPKEQKVIFARHGESEASRDDIFAGTMDTPLTDKGREQARATAKNLKGRNITKIITSTLCRASETAEIIRKELGLDLEIEVWPELKEIEWGDYTGRKIGNPEMIREAAANPTAESAEEIMERGRKIWEKLKTVTTTGEILIAGHSTLTCAMYAQRQNKTPEDFPTYRENWHMEPAQAITTSVFQAPEVGQKIIFARHGESEANVNSLIGNKDMPLTENGKEHAINLAQTLKNKGITKIISSEFVSAHETAKIIGQELGVSVEVDRDWRGVDAGELNGRPQSEYPPGISQTVGLMTAGLLDESVDEYAERISNAYERLKEIETEGTILVVTHRTSFSMFELVEGGENYQNIVDKRTSNENLPHGILREMTLSDLRQDEDTLDTWFSSALWPFSTLGWPDESADFEKFYPNDVLETGWDILFFWVARMIMFGRYATGQYPFHTVYLHGLVCDEHGKKMSKSKGNGIDPLEVIEEVGADAVRLSLVIGTSPGNPIPLGKNKIKGYRNFVNKLWNAGRFVQMQLEDRQSPSLGGRVRDGGFAEADFDIERASLADKWILSRLSRVAKEVAGNLEQYEISSAGDAIYHFVWDEFCDWYIEASKVELNPEILKYAYGEILKLTHPLCPFVTETIYKELFDAEGSIMDLEYPAPKFEDDQAESTFKTVQNLVTEIRRIRAEKKLNPKEKVVAKIRSNDAQIAPTGELLKVLGNLSEIEIGPDVTKPEKATTSVVDGHDLYVEIPFDEEAEKARLEKEIEQLQKKIAGLEGRLSNPSYTEKAPANLVQQTRDELTQAKEDLEKMEAEIQNL